MSLIIITIIMATLMFLLPRVTTYVIITPVLGVVFGSLSWALTGLFITPTFVSFAGYGGFVGVTTIIIGSLCFLERVIIEKKFDDRV